MTVGDRVETREGLGTIVGKREKNHLDSRQWWYVDLDEKEDFLNPYHFLEREIKIVE